MNKNNEKEEKEKEKEKNNEKSQRISLVTGSTQGVGLSIAEKLGFKGDKIIISSRKEENSYRAEERLVMSNVDYDYFMCDFDNKIQRKELADYLKRIYGKLDTLILCVQTIAYFGDLMDISEKEYNKIYSTNIKNNFFTIMDFLSLLKNGTDACIVLLGSHSVFSPNPFEANFSLSKSVFLSLTKLLAKELSKYKIRVNCVCPGFMKTKLTISIVDNKYHLRNFLKRDSLPHETAALCAFLTTKDSSFINGENILINGGVNGRL
jgi:dehydrogenase/reductase SDR family protein 4